MSDLLIINLKINTDLVELKTYPIVEDTAN